MKTQRAHKLFIYYFLANAQISDSSQICFQFKWIAMWEYYPIANIRKPQTCLFKKKEKAWSGELVLKQRSIFNFITRSSSNRNKLAAKENSKHDT